MKVRNLLMANGFGQLVTLFIQLAGLPLLLRLWGVEWSGLWVAINAIPMMLSVSDLGVFVVLGNEIIKYRQVQDYDNFRKSNQVMMQFAVVLMLFVFIFCLILNYYTLSVYSRPELTSIEMLTLSVVVGLNAASMVMQNLLRAQARISGKLATVIGIFNFQRLLSFSIVLFVVMMRQGIVWVSIASFIPILMSCIYVAKMVHVVCGGSWRGELFWVMICEIKKSYPSVAFTFSNLFITQMITTLLAHRASAVDVVSYSVIRIMGRPCLQLSALITSSAWPKIAEYNVAGDFSGVSRLMHKCGAVYYTLFFCGGLSVVFCSRELWGILSGGRLPYDIMMVAVSMLEGGLIGAVNLHYNKLVACGQFKRYGNLVYVLSILALIFAYVSLENWRQAVFLQLVLAVCMYSTLILGRWRAS